MKPSQVTDEHKKELKSRLFMIKRAISREIDDDEY
jgi:hypothetical protein